MLLVNLNMVMLNQHRLVQRLLLHQHHHRRIQKIGLRILRYFLEMGWLLEYYLNHQEKNLELLDLKRRHLNLHYLQLVDSMLHIHHLLM
jgi:hypothetical protein